MRFHFPFSRRLSLPLLLIVRLIGVMSLYQLSRFLFYIFNLKSFGQLDFFELIRLMFIGIRFDLSAVAMINIPVILLMTLPFAFRYNRPYQLAVNIIFVIINTIGLIFNLIDVIFFRYIAKRSTSEVFEFFGNTNENVGQLIGQFVIDFWYMLCIFILFVYALIKIVTIFVSHSPLPVRRFNWYIKRVGVFILFLAFSVLFIRGGLQLKPISLITAAKYTESRNIPLLINTPFSIVKTFGSMTLPEKHYFNENEVDAIFNPKHYNLKQNLIADSNNFKGYNVVVLILESMGRNYIGYYTPRAQSLTPFLDSLFAKSITFNGFANGKRSIEALPSIFAGIPSLMPMDYPTSPYIGNKIEGMGTLLKKQGYQTAFFHGGNNGTMGFDVFSSIAGFDAYFGRNEYDNDADFDQQWGIFDGPFLQYTANKLNHMQQPFGAGIFTLSSHHPYHLPPGYENAFPYANNKIEASFCYLDASLKQFFTIAQSMPWFKKTIFVITADHTPEQSQSSSQRQFWNLYAAPICFYIPSAKGYRSETIAQHTDILPSVMALLNFDEPVFSFGRNLMDTNQMTYASNHLSGIYQSIFDGYLMIHNGESALELYDIESDPELEKNLINDNDSLVVKNELFLKAILQQYNNRMIHNSLFVEKP